MTTLSDGLAERFAALRFEQIPDDGIDIGPERQPFEGALGHLVQASGLLGEGDLEGDLLLDAAQRVGERFRRLARCVPADRVHVGAHRARHAARVRARAGLRRGALRLDVVWSGACRTIGARAAHRATAVAVQHRLS